MTGRVGPFLKIPLLVLSRRDLTSAAKLVYAVVVDRMGSKKVAWPGIRRIARDLGVSENAVLRATAKLEAVGLLAVVRSSSGKVNTYRLPETVAETAAVKGSKALPKRLRKRCRNGYGSKTESAAETEVGVAETATEALPKRLHNQTDPITRPTTARKARTSRAQKPDSAHQDFITYFVEAWGNLIGGGVPYRFNGAKDGAAVKRILEAVRGDLDRAKRLADAYLADGDAWLTEKAPERPLVILASDARLRKYIAATATAPSSANAAPDRDHPVIEDARRRWPEDVQTHLAEYEAVARIVERGDVAARVVKDSKAASGPEFRQSVQRGAAHATG